MLRACAAGVWPYYNGSSAFSNGTGGTFMYDRYLQKLAAAGGNYIRLWVCPSLVSEPTYDGEQASMLGLGLGALVPFGTYNLEAAWRGDYIVERARALGIKITVVLITTQELCDPGVWCFWEQSSWNVANGGPLADPASLWTDGASLAELRQRWRFVLARWAYATSVFSWELSNENEGFAGWGPVAADAQLALASFVSAHDAYGHLIDNSFMGDGADAQAMEMSPLIAFSSAHIYNAPDFASAVWDSVTPRVPRYAKPAFLQEFGASWKGPLEHELDPTGIAMHNAAWASAVGLGAGTGMQWWWNEVDALNTYSRLTGAAVFMRDAVGGARLLALTWRKWDVCHSSPECADTHAGWTAGFDDAGTVRAALYFVYSRNHTWAAQHKGAPLYPVSGCTTTLSGLPSVGSARVTWFNTTTGLPLAAEGGTALLGTPAHPAASVAPGSVDLDAPTFTTDAAALVEWPTAA